MRGLMGAHVTSATRPHFVESWVGLPCHARGGVHQTGATLATLERRFADAVPRAASAMDAAVDVIAQEEGLLRAFSITLTELVAAEAELESILALYEHNSALKANGPVRAAVEAAIEEVIAATSIRDDLCTMADQDAEVALHGSKNADGLGAGAGAGTEETSAIVAVLPTMPDPAQLSALVASIQRTTPMVQRAYVLRVYLTRTAVNCPPPFSLSHTYTLTAGVMRLTRGWLLLCRLEQKRSRAAAATRQARRHPNGVGGASKGRGAAGPHCQRLGTLAFCRRVRLGGAVVCVCECVVCHTYPLLTRVFLCGVCGVALRYAVLCCAVLYCVKNKTKQNREKILNIRGDAQAMLAAQGRRNDAIKAVDRAITAVANANATLHDFDQSPVPTVADLVNLSAAVSDAKVFADFAYELVGEVTNPEAAAAHARSRGVRVLQRARALVADAAGRVKEGKMVVEKLQRHTAFNIGASFRFVLCQRASLLLCAVRALFLEVCVLRWPTAW